MLAIALVLAVSRKRALPSTTARHTPAALSVGVVTHAAVTVLPPVMAPLVALVGVAVRRVLG